MYRTLTTNEIDRLRVNGNIADEWDKVMVSDPFNPDLFIQNRFSGTVRLGVYSMGATEKVLDLPEGISHCWIRNSSIGSHCSISQVRLIDNYTIGENVTLFNVGQLTAVIPFSIKPASVMNENGGRAVSPCPDMTVSDAYLWGKYRHSQRLISAFRQLAERQQPDRAYVGDGATIINSQRIHNVIVQSDENSPSSIAEAISIEEGVVGYGCRIERGCVLRCFLLGENVHIEDVARINDSVIGDNSTIARCEVGNSLIFPAHEQHHNNSFLIAATIMGQSNLAAGATIGSNHNGRTADNELVARRGFWPGLCVSFKHPSYFASYCLAAKGDYPSELNIVLPFSLINNNVSANRLEVMPAYWWMYNMYALHRNECKFDSRDRRRRKKQHIEFSPLAPDTVEEIVCARELLRSWIEQSYLANLGLDDRIEVTANNMENGRRKVVILKAAKGYQAYEDMLYYYIGSVLAEGMTEDNRRCPDFSYDCHRETHWVNLGGQVVAQSDLKGILSDIEQGIVCSWTEVHQRLDNLWEAYPEQKRRHAYGLLCQLAGATQLTEDVWQQMLTRYDEARRFVVQQVRASREKDESNPYRRMTFDNDDEMKAVFF